MANLRKTNVLNFLFKNKVQIQCSRRLNVCVEGNIGSGKSTLLQRIAAKLQDNVRVFSEPIDRWRNVSGHNLCSKMYELPDRWGFTFQNYVQLTMAERHRQIATSGIQFPNRLHIMERSLLSARYVFVENLYRHHLINEMEYTVLDQFANHFFQQGSMDHIDIIVYLRVDPQTCLQHIIQRGRQEEANLKLESLAYLHDLHEQLLTGNGQHWPINLKSIPVLTIDSNDNVDLLLDQLDQWPKVNYKQSNSQ